MSLPRIRPDEVEFSAIRAQGTGGQHVNKVATAAHLRFDIGLSSLPAELQQRLRDWPDQRISRDGVVVIKAQDHRSLLRNQADALARLQALVDQVATLAPPRRPTRPTRGSQRRRLQAKAQRAQTKAGRGTCGDD